MLTDTLVRSILAAWCLMITCLWESRVEQVYVGTVTSDVVNCFSGLTWLSWHKALCHLLCYQTEKILNLSFCLLILEYSNSN